MYISTRLLRMQVALLKPFVNGCSIEAARAGQEKIGELMSRTHKKRVSYSPVEFEKFQGEWIIPRSTDSRGAILYLHGGGYVAGDTEYAKGFGTILAAKNNIRVFCAAYRLAPENPFPAALKDAVTSYQYLLQSGYKNGEIILCGESAGGGLVYSLCLKLKEMGVPLPGGIIAISPWTDLTLSGKSYEDNIHRDPSMAKERLQYYARCYAENYTDPFVSPLFGDLSHMPPSVIFAGGDEIMLDDAVRMDKKLRESGSKSVLTVTGGMWHAYVLYGVRETKADHEKISGHIMEVVQ